jgi:ADP-heptose:LPS heptosyltransferase
MMRIGVFSGQDLVGDALLKIPFLRGLRACFPAAEITWLTARGSVFSGPMAAVAERLLDHVVPHCGVGCDWREVMRPAPALGPFDLLLDTQSRIGVSLLVRRLRHRRFVAAAVAARGAGPHMLDGMFALLAKAAARPILRDLSPLTVPPALAAAAAAALPPGPTYVALAPGSGGPQKSWPVDRYAALAAWLVTRGAVPVALIGPQDEALRGALRAAVPDLLEPEADPAFGFLLPGPQPLRVVAIAARCALGVANDAGPGHMIAASGTPLVSLFGPTRPEKFRPVMSRNGRCLQAKDYGQGRTMAELPLYPVQQAVDSMLSQTADPRGS